MLLSHAELKVLQRDRKPGVHQYFPHLYPTFQCPSLMQWIFQQAWAHELPQAKILFWNIQIGLLDSTPSPPSQGLYSSISILALDSGMVGGGQPKGGEISFVNQSWTIVTQTDTQPMADSTFTLPRSKHLQIPSSRHSHGHHVNISLNPSTLRSF